MASIETVFTQIPGALTVNEFLATATALAVRIRKQLHSKPRVDLKDLSKAESIVGILLPEGK